MPWSFSTYRPETVGHAEKYDIPINRWMSSKYGLGDWWSLGEVYDRFLEERFDDSPEISPDQANKDYGIPGQLTFDKPVRERTASLLRERKELELDREATIASASHRAISIKGIAGFGAQIAGSLSSPIDMGVTLMPFVGSSTKAAGIARAGGSALRVRLAQGLLTTEERLAASRIPFPRITGSVIDASIGNAIAEIPTFLQATHEQAHYGPMDSILNIAAGGLFAGTVKGIGLAIADGLTRAGKVIREMEIDTVERMGRKAVDDFVNDRPIQVQTIAQLDPNVVAKNVESTATPRRIDEPKMPELKSEVSRVEKLYQEEHASLLETQQKLEDVKKYEPGRESSLEAEQSDRIQRMAEWDRLYGRSEEIKFEDSVDSATAKAIRQNPKLTLEEAAVEGDRQRRIDIENRIFDKEPIPSSAIDEFGMENPVGYIRQGDQYVPEGYIATEPPTPIARDAIDNEAAQRLSREIEAQKAPEQAPTVPEPVVPKEEVQAHTLDGSEKDADVFAKDMEDIQSTMMPEDVAEALRDMPEDAEPVLKAALPCVINLASLE